MTKSLKKASTIIACLLVTGLSVFAQSPQLMSYQAVVRNSAGQLVVNRNVGMQVSILQGTVTGRVVFKETHTPAANANVLVSLSVGGGTAVSGSMAAIDWAAGPYFIKTETDAEGGTNYTITGTSQLLSVPYALHAKTGGLLGYGDFYTSDGSYDYRGKIPFPLNGPLKGSVARRTASDEFLLKSQGTYQVVVNLKGQITGTITLILNGSPVSGAVITIGAAEAAMSGTYLINTPYPNSTLSLENSWPINVGSNGSSHLTITQID